MRLCKVTSSALALSALTLAALALSGCPGSTPPLTPPAPANVTATAGHGSVTVSWDASTGATGYRVYYGTGAAGAVTKTSSSADSGAALFLSVSGLADGTAYRFAVAARGPGGEGPLSAEADATPAANVPLAVAATVPADGATGALRNEPLALTFNKAVQGQSVTGQAADGACTGSVQLSRDAFSTCVSLAAAPVLSGAGKAFTLTPGAALAGNTVWKVKVTTAARDAAGIALAADFAQATGFTTVVALALATISPADGATAVARGRKITAGFTRPVSAASAQVNTVDAACTGATRRYRIHMKAAATTP